VNDALLVVAFVVAVNPARLHSALPHADSRTARLAATALGAAVTLVVYVLLAAAAGPMLDALDIDDASARIAAGLVLLVAGLRDLVGRPPTADPALPGWRAALVPVTVPLLLRPEVAMLTIIAGADEGIAATVIAAVVALALVVVSSWAPGDATPFGPQVRTWLARVTAVALVVIAVDLAVDGILAV
jgi:small neutral amino acid transporter SnatA (MarC family)